MNLPASGPKAPTGLIIRADRCENCKFMQPLQGTEMQCRRNPPTFVAFPVQTPQGVKVEMFSNWSPTQANFWCGEHRPRIDAVH